MTPATVAPRPSNFRVYRPALALELSLVLPKPAEGGTYLEPGRLFVTMAAGVARESYDWPGALRLALAPGELGQVLEGLTGPPGSEVSIIHDPAAGGPGKGALVKSLRLKRGDGGDGGELAGRVMVSMGSKAGGGPWRSVGTIGLSPGELAVVRELVRAAVPVLLGWAA